MAKQSANHTGGNNAASSNACRSSRQGQVTNQAVLQRNANGNRINTLPQSNGSGASNNQAARAFEAGLRALDRRPVSMLDAWLNAPPCSTGSEWVTGGTKPKGKKQ